MRRRLYLPDRTVSTGCLFAILLYLLCCLFLAPDKRTVPALFNDPPPNIPKRGQKKSPASSGVFNIESIVDISLEEGSAPSQDSSDGLIEENYDLRDSGISVEDNSHLNNFNNTCYEDFDLRLHQQEMNIVSQDSPKTENHSAPPPIPPKAAVSMSVEVDSLDRRTRHEVVSPDNYSVPKLKGESGVSQEDEEDIVN